MIVALWVWLRAEEREGRLADARLDRDAAARTRAAVDRQRDNCRHFLVRNGRLERLTIQTTNRRPLGPID